MTNNAILTIERPLSLRNGLAWLVQAVFLGTTILLPIAAHAFGWSVFVALPMFWGVMLAGVVYGWQGGLAIALLSPIVNYFLTGMPVLSILPLMTVELVAYGTLPSLLRDRVFRGNLFISTAVAIVIGRVLIMAGFVLFLGGIAGLPQWATARLLPGVPTQLVQIFGVPIAGSMLIRGIRKD